MLQAIAVQNGFVSRAVHGTMVVWAIEQSNLNRVKCIFFSSWVLSRRLIVQLGNGRIANFSLVPQLLPYETKVVFPDNDLVCDDARSDWKRVCGGILGL